jgi:hypothetical protein
MSEVFFSCGLQTFELLFDESERGVNVSDEAWLDDEDNRLNQIEFGENLVRITTNAHQFELDLRKVAKEEIEQAKAILLKMNFDHNFEMLIA